MGYSVTIHEAAQAVLVTHVGHWDLAEFRQARLEAAEVVQKTGLKRILVDGLQVPGKPSVLDQFAFASEHDQFIPPGIRLAVVVPAAVMSAVVFTEDVSVNRQIDMRMFTDLPSAVAWLTRDA